MLPIDNHALALSEYREGKVVLQSTPNLITLETTSRCNLRCVMCSHAIDGVDRPKHLNEKLSDAMSSFLSRAGAIQLHGIGEPTNSPAFWMALSSLPSAELCESSINTNFAAINKQQIERLVDSNLRLINVSLDAASATTYQKIRGFDFSKVIANIRYFQELKVAKQLKYPMLYLNMTLMRSNIEELVDFIELGKNLGAQYVCAWHLNRWSQAEMNRFVVERDGWTFNYSQEGLWNHPQLSNHIIRQARERALELDIAFWLPTSTIVFFDETAA